MTQHLYLVTKSESEGESLVNGVRAVLLNRVSTATDAELKASAVSAANAAYGSTDAFDAGYFDTVVQIDDLSGGPLNGEKKAYTFDPNAGPIASTAIV